MKKYSFLFIFLFVDIAFTQTLLLEENFNYGNTATDLVTASSSVWTNHSGGTGTNDVQYSVSGLSYTGYPSSGVGGSANISNSRTGDDNRTFTPQNSGSVYLSALVNVSNATTSTNGEYFLHFGTSTFYARIYARASDTDLNFGVSKYNEGATFSTTNFSFNTTYLIVIKYTFIAGSANDRVDMWVISSGVPSSEANAGPPTIENVTASNTDASNLSAVSLRQGSAVCSVVVDGLRISDSWSQAPLPVELSSFSAIVLDNIIQLKWRTETEVNNYGFEILRRIYPAKGGTQNDNWLYIGFVNGNGNSNSPKDYSFINENISAGKYSYRLKQIDTDGQFEYSKIISVEIGSPVKLELSQNYPNPFNPSTTISFSLPKPGNVKLTIYNTIGQQVAEIINSFKDAGVHTINFDGSGLNSGIYIYKLEANGLVQTKKMMLLK